MSEDQAVLRVDEVEEEPFHAHVPFWDGGTVVLCMAVLYHVEPEAFESIMIATSKYGREKVRFMAQERTCVWDSRNYLAQRFLATDAEWMIFIDADHLIPCGSARYFNTRGRVKLPDRIAGINFIERMLSHSPTKGVVGASYYDRQVGKQVQCSKGSGSHAQPGFNEAFRRGEMTGVDEVLWTATGGMRIHRAVFEGIMKNKAQFPEITPLKEGGRWGFFTPNRVGLGEDVAFCYRARQSGFKIWQDYDCRMLHKGHRFV